MLAFLKRNHFFLLDLGTFIYLTSYGVQLLSTKLLIQDKICLIRHNQSKHFCQNIHETMLNQNDELLKNRIFSEAAQFENYKYEKFIQNSSILIFIL